MKYALIDGEDASTLCCGETFTLEEVHRRCAENGWQVDKVLSATIVVDTCPIPKGFTAPLRVDVPKIKFRSLWHRLVTWLRYRRMVAQVRRRGGWVSGDYDDSIVVTHEPVFPRKRTLRPGWTVDQ